jgi:chorismate mutase
LAFVPSKLRALRGATTIANDTTADINERVVALLDAMFERNQIDHDDLVSILFTATDDIHAAFPAGAARKFGLGDVPLICARELDIVGGTPMCVRIMVHLYTERDRTELRHVYLEGASGLRDDLPT